MTQSLSTLLAHPLLRDSRAAALVPPIAAGAALFMALLSQYAFGLAPCVLCIYQRYGHGWALAFGLIAFLAPARHRPLLVLLAIGGLLASAGIAGFHVGVEWKWWEGTAECGSTLDLNASVADLKQALLAAPTVRCDEVPWSLFGISMAGYNLLYSLAAALLTVVLLRRKMAH
ncbi:disulfide bond formation protein B [Rhodovibrionaceae bacterium A322]